MAFSSSDDDFEEPRFIIRSPRLRKDNAQTANQTYRDEVTPRRASDKIKSIRAQSKSRDRTAVRSPASTKQSSTSDELKHLQFTSDESNEEVSPPKNQPVVPIQPPGQFNY